VQEQEIEGVDADALQRALRGHPQIRRVLRRPAQARIGEAREALRPGALAVVEVVADRPDEAVLGPRHADQRTSEQRVGRPRSIGVGGHDGVDAIAGRQQRGEPVLLDGLAEAHEAPTAPGADGDVSGIAHSPESVADRGRGTIGTVILVPDVPQMSCR
jgi:hypothetical protein